MNEPTMLVRLVDDDAELLKSTQFLLRMAGFEVLAYESAESFLELDDPARLGCLVLDQRMPGMTGLELQEAISERSETLPIIFLSAHGDIPMAMRAVHAGASDFLVKPVDPEVLIEAVRKACAQSAEAAAAAVSSVDEEACRRVADLTGRERAVAEGVAKGLLNKQIADELGISLVTVKMHRGNVTKKLGVKSAVAIAEMLRRAGAEAGVVR